MLNNRTIISLTWQDLVLGCNYKTKIEKKKKKEEKGAKRRKGFIETLEHAWKVPKGARRFWKALVHERFHEIPPGSIRF